MGKHETGFTLGDGEMVAYKGRLYFTEWVDEYGITLTRFDLPGIGLDHRQAKDLSTVDEYMVDEDLAGTEFSVELLKAMLRPIAKAAKALEKEIERLKESE